MVKVRQTIVVTKGDAQDAKYHNMLKAEEFYQVGFIVLLVLDI